MKGDQILFDYSTADAADVPMTSTFVSTPSLIVGDGGVDIPSSTKKTSAVMSTKEKSKTPSDAKKSEQQKLEELRKEEERAWKRKQVEDIVRRKEEAERERYEAIELLLEPTSKSLLLDCSRFLQPKDFDMVVEERGAGKLCGYPTCEMPTQDHSKAQFKVSLRERKVYDRTEARDFCSLECMFAAKVFRQQLDETPLHLRCGDPKEVKLPESPPRPTNDHDAEVEERIDTLEIKERQPQAPTTKRRNSKVSFPDEQDGHEATLENVVYFDKNQETAEISELPVTPRNPEEPVVVEPSYEQIQAAVKETMAETCTAKKSQRKSEPQEKVEPVFIPELSPYGTVWSALSEWCKDRTWAAARGEELDVENLYGEDGEDDAVHSDEGVYYRPLPQATSKLNMMLDHILKPCASICQQLGLEYASVESEIRTLVKTFMVRKDKPLPSLKPAWWRAICLVCLDVVSWQRDDIKAKLDTEAEAFERLIDGTGFDIHYFRCFREIFDPSL